MRFGVLGPLELVDGDADATPSAPKPRQVLALLVMRRNEVVRISELVTELWGEEAPPSALPTVQTYIYKLRKLLPEEGERAAGALLTRPAGYLLATDDENVDSCRFQRLADEGRAAMTRGDPATAAHRLGAALALWRGAALADVTTGELLSGEVTRLEASRLDALELRIAADLALDRNRDLVSELKVITANHPLHEGFHAKLMFALQRSGRRFEALDVYQRLRHALLYELGVEPSEPLRELHRAMLSANSPLLPAVAAHATGPMAGPPGPVVAVTTGAAPAAPRPPAAAARPVTPRPPATASRPQTAASRPQTATSRPQTTASRPPAATRTPAAAVPPRAVATQLPDHPRSLCGRRDALERLANVLVGAPPRTAARVVAVTGMPGVGKTALAVFAAHRMAGHFPDGQLYVDLAGSTGRPVPPHDALGELLAVCGTPRDRLPVSTTERCSLFRTLSARRRMLIVLDDAVSAGQAGALLPGTPSCGVIVTTRSHPLPGAEAIPLEVLEVDDGVALLAQVLGGTRLAAQLPAARRIVAACGGLPLAVRAAATRLAAMPGCPLAQFADRLADVRTQLDELRLGDCDVPARYGSSYRRLREWERSAFRMLSLMRSAEFSVNEVAALLGCDPARARLLLDRLAEHHLLRAEWHHAGKELRYRFHLLVRAFARQQLEHLLQAGGLLAADRPAHDYAPCY